MSVATIGPMVLAEFFDDLWLQRAASLGLFVQVALIRVVLLWIPIVLMAKDPRGADALGKAGIARGPLSRLMGRWADGCW